MNHRNLPGAIALVSGTTIGAVTLVLPIILNDLGVVCSTGLFFLIWGMMWAAALLTLEVSLSLPKNTSFVSMTYHTLGRAGEWITWLCFLSLLYSLLTFYFSGLSGVFGDIALIESTNSLNVILVSWLLIVALALKYGAMWIDYINRYVILALLMSFIVLVFIVSPHIQFDFNKTDPTITQTLSALGVIMTAFGYQVVIPSMKDYLDGDQNSCRKAILWGSVGPLVVYVVWTIMFMGVANHFSVTSTGLTPIESLHAVFSKLSSNKLFFLKIFIVMSILSSFLGIALGLFDFLKDGFKSHQVQISRWGIILLTLLPPFIVIKTNPQVFLLALKYAVILVAILNLIIPVLMSISLHHFSSRNTFVNRKIAMLLQFLLMIFAVLVLIKPL